MLFPYGGRRVGERAFDNFFGETQKPTETNEKLFFSFPGLRLTCWPSDPQQRTVPLESERMGAKEEEKNAVPSSSSHTVTK